MKNSNQKLKFLLWLLIGFFFACCDGWGQQQTIIQIRDGKVDLQNSSAKEDSIFKTYKVSYQEVQRTSATITLSITTIPATCEYNNGTILITATGGTAPYSYTVVGYWTQQTGFFPRVLPGTYPVQVTDALGETASGTVTVTSTTTRPVLWVTSTQTATGCNTPTASVTLGVTSGTPPFEYSLDGINYQSSNIFSGLYPGIYMFLVRDANNCRGNVSNFINGTMHPANCYSSVALSHTQGICINDGVINIHLPLNAPNTPYTFSLDGINYQSSGSFSGLSTGVHTIFYKSSIGVVTVFALNMYLRCDIVLNYVAASTVCGQSTGTITLNPTGGSPPYTYTMDGVNFQTSNIFTGLSAGWYFVRVQDANAMTTTNNVQVGDLCPLLSLTATSETCLLNDGTISASASGSGPFIYSIDGINFQSNNTFTGLQAGSYTITAKDNFGFTQTATIAVSYGCLLVNTITVHPTCGINNGNIVVTATNGTVPYQYSIDGINFQTANIFANLAPGNYTITVRDNGNKVGTAAITLNNIPGPQVSTTVQQPTCTNNNGIITIGGTGGNLPYQYSLDGIVFQSSPIFNSLSSGSYIAWIKDVNSCMASVAVTLSVLCPTITVQTSNATCGNSNGSITAIGSNGTAPYTYSTDGINFQSSGIFTGLQGGTYTITLKDAAGITNSTTARIATSCPTVTGQPVDGLCGNANAGIIATGANGTLPYEYSLDGINFQNSNTFTNLQSGTYTVTVRDADGLKNTTSVTVQNFPAPQLTASVSPASCLNNDGSIRLQATGGTLPFMYDLNGSGFQASNIFLQLGQGDYAAAIKDANGCVVNQTVTLGITNNLSLSAGATIALCEGKTVVLPALSNGTGFQWTPGNTLSNAQLLNPTASPVTNTKYYIRATLGNCTRLDSVMVQVNLAPVPDAGKDIAICYQQPTQLQGAGGVTYNWTPSTYLDNPQSSQPRLVNPATTIKYRLLVTDALGCSSLQSDEVQVTVTPMPALSAGKDTAITFNQPFQLSATDINNSGFTNFTWTPATGLSNTSIFNPVATIDKPITYIVLATTPAGCAARAAISLKVYKGPDIYVPTAFTPNNDGLNDLLRAIPVGIKQFLFFAVYNRWGQQVFYTTDPHKGWNGRFGQQVQDGNMFVWTAAGMDEKGNTIIRKGTVMVIR